MCVLSNRFDTQLENGQHFVHKRLGAHQPRQESERVQHLHVGRVAIGLTERLLALEQATEHELMFVHLFALVRQNAVAAALTLEESQKALELAGTRVRDDP